MGCRPPFRAHGRNGCGRGPADLGPEKLHALQKSDGKARGGVKLQLHHLPRRRFRTKPVNAFAGPEPCFDRLNGHQICQFTTGWSQYSRYCVKLSSTALVPGKNTCKLHKHRTFKGMVATRCLMALLLLPAASSFHASLSPPSLALRTASCHALHHQRHPGLYSIRVLSQPITTDSGLHTLPVCTPPCSHPPHWDVVWSLILPRRTLNSSSPSRSHQIRVFPLPPHPGLVIRHSAPTSLTLDSLIDRELWRNPQSKQPPPILNPTPHTPPKS